MTTRSFISIGVSTGAALTAIVIATPALANTGANNGPEMTYEERQYEYAQPAPVAVPQAAPIRYRQEAVVQQVPQRAARPAPIRYAKGGAPVRYVKDQAGADYAVAPHAAPARHYQAPRYVASGSERQVSEPKGG